MDENYDAASKRECCVCFTDLHLSAVRCSCSADCYSCLIHAKELCPCLNKIFLYRYTIDDLNVLLEALAGKYSAMYRWAKQYLNVSRSSSVPAGSQTSNPDTKTRDKKPDETYHGARPSDSGKFDAASIKAQVKARVKARSLEQIMKVQEDKDESPAVSGRNTGEKLLPQRETRSSGSDVADDPRVEGKSSQLKGCASGKKNGEESSKPAPLKKSSPKRSTRPSDSSALDKPKKQRPR